MTTARPIRKRENVAAEHPELVRDLLTQLEKRLPQ